MVAQQQQCLWRLIYRNHHGRGTRTFNIFQTPHNFTRSVLLFDTLSVRFEICTELSLGCRLKQLRPEFFARRMFRHRPRQGGHVPHILFMIWHSPTCCQRMPLLPSATLINHISFAIRNGDEVRYPIRGNLRTPSGENESGVCTGFHGTVCSSSLELLAPSMSSAAQ